MTEEKKDDIYDEEDLEEDEEEDDGVGLFTKIKEALNPRKIIKYILSNLWKPVLVSILLLSFSLAGVYAAAYYKLLDAKNALDFEPSMVQLRETENPVIKYMLPLIEWSSATLSAAGEIMQTRVDQIDKEREALKQQEEENKKQENTVNDVKDDTQKQGNGNSTDAKKTPENKEPKRPSQEELKKQREEEAELKRLAEVRLQELNKRASRLAAYYSSMPPKDAVEILKKMDDDEIIVIMNRMENDVASQILAGFEPERASAVSKKILKLQPAPLIVDDKDAKEVL